MIKWPSLLYKVLRSYIISAASWSTVQFKCPLSDSVFSVRQKGCVFNGTLSCSSVKVKWLWVFHGFRAILVSIQWSFYRMCISQSLNLSFVLCIKEKSTLNKIIFLLCCERLKHCRFEDFLEHQNKLKRRYCFHILYDL